MLPLVNQTPTFAADKNTTNKKIMLRCVKHRTDGAQLALVVIPAVLGLSSEGNSLTNPVVYRGSPGGHTSSNAGIKWRDVFPASKHDNVQVQPALCVHAHRKSFLCGICNPIHSYLYPSLPLSLSPLLFHGIRSTSLHINLFGLACILWSCMQQ